MTEGFALDSFLGMAAVPGVALGVAPGPAPAVVDIVFFVHAANC